MDTARKLLFAGKPEEALIRLRRVLLNAKPEDIWKVYELIAAAFHDLCNFECAAQACLDASRTDIYLRSQREHLSNYLFMSHYLPGFSTEDMKFFLDLYASLFVNENSFGFQSHSRAEKISVAFIAPHFCDSSSARFYEALLTDYDREKFSVTAWSLSSYEDQFTKKIRRNVDGYFDISETSLSGSAIRIFEKKADVLFDLGGHTEGGLTLQIAAHRPAWMQMTGIGYCDSTGLDKMHFFVGDRFLTKDAYFSEEIFPLKNAFAFRPNAVMIREKKSLRPSPHKNFTFGCLNNFMKVNKHYLRMVKAILDNVPGSKIIFRDTTPLESRRRALAYQLEELEIRSAEVYCGTDNFFSDYAKIDLILDTFPYPGGMMTALALYMGVPVLNLCGKLPGSRTGADILRIAGLEKLIVYDKKTYIALAIELAKNREWLAELTKKISVKKLTDTKAFVKDFYSKVEIVVNENSNGC